MKTREELEARRDEIIAFLKKHFQNDPQRINNFITKFPNYSESDLNMDPSSEANEVADYEVGLEIEQTMENELMEIQEQLQGM
jgi:hypothetical protein